ncbi:MAG: hypothetical protein QOH39_2884 [Verrucomicrobiota bacterium]|jgi:hypothetical protein
MKPDVFIQHRTRHPRWVRVSRLLSLVALLTLSSPPAAPASSFAPGDFHTYGQAEWASDPTATNLLQGDFGLVYGSTGGTLRVGTAMLSITFDGGNFVIAYLPASGPPGPLNEELDDPTNTSSGVYGGDVTALALNVDYSAFGLLLGTSTLHFGELTLKGFTGALAGLNGMLVKDFLALNETALGGGSTPISIANLDPVLQQVNGSFTTGVLTQFAQAHLEAPCVPPPANLVSWWPANGNPADLIGGNGGVLKNGATFATGEVRKAFSLDGANDFVQVAAPSGLPVGNSARTIDFWFQTPVDLTTSTESSLVQYGTAVSGEMFGLITSQNARGKLYFFGYAADLAGTTTIQPNTWYHAAVTYDGTRVTLYLNGQIEASAPLALNTIIDGNGLTFGLRPDTNAHWTGLIDEVEIFRRALSASEILGIYNAGNAGQCLPIMYAATGLNGVAGNLYTINPSTAASSLVGPIINTSGSGAIGLTGLDFNPLDGTLYGITANSTSAGGNTVAKSLVTIDPATAFATVIGSLGIANTDISFRPDGTLFGFQSNETAGSIHSMTKINLGTGVSTVLGSSGLASTNGGGLAFDEGGTLYLSATGSSGTLDTLNPSKGTRTVGGSMTGAPVAGSINAMAANGETLFGVDSDGSISRNSVHLVTISRGAAAATVTDIGLLPGDTDAISRAYSPIEPWLVSYGFAFNTDPLSDPNSDGVSLLMAYALDLNPTQNLTISLPRWAFTPGQMSLTFWGGSTGVFYSVETSTDLHNWTTTGVTISGPDADHFYTATVARSGTRRFMHLKVVYQP